MDGLHEMKGGSQIHQSNPALPNIPRSQLERLNEYYGRGGGPEMENIPSINERLKRINYNSNDQPFDYGGQNQNSANPIMKPPILQSAASNAEIHSYKR